MYMLNKQTIKDGMLSLKVIRSISSVLFQVFEKVISVDAHSCKAKIKSWWQLEKLLLAVNADVLQIV